VAARALESSTSRERMRWDLLESCGKKCVRVCVDMWVFVCMCVGGVGGGGGHICVMKGIECGNVLMHI